MSKIKHIRYELTGKEEFVTLDKYHRLHQANVHITKVRDLEV